MGVLVGKNAGSSISVTATFEGKSGSVTGISVSQINPILEFVNNNESPTTYDGTQKCLGYIAYTGDGTVYYQVIKATSQPSVPSASDSGWINIGGGDYIYGSDEDVATEAGTYYVFLKSTAGTSYTAVNPKSAGNTVVNKATGANPTFGNSSVSAQLAPTAATTSPAVNCGAFTAATAGHGGSITYSLVSVNGGSVGSWTMTSNTSRVIKVPASTAGGTYTIVVRATEAATTNYTSSYKDATITVTVNKKTSEMTISPTTKTIYSITSNGTGNPSDYTYNTFTITPSGNIGTVTYSSNATSKATVTSAGVVSYVSAGSATITATDPGNNYWASVSKTCAVTCTLDSVSNSNYSPSNYVASATITNDSGLTAAGGSATVTASASHKANNLYASGYVDSTKHDVTDTATWSITSQTFTPKPSGSASTITRFSKSSNTLSHSTMAKNIGVDSVTVTAVNSSSSSATGTATATIDNKRTWGNVSLTVSSPDTPYTMAAAGETKAITASATQTASYTSGASDSYSPVITYAVTTSATGFSLSSNSVTATNNTSTSTRGNCVVTVTATGKTGTDSTYDSGYGKTATSARTFNQAAGTQVYANPTVLTYTYANFAASGETKTPTVTYSQSWTWNGVSGSGGTITTGGSLTFDTNSRLPSGFSTGSNYTTTGSVTWANRTTDTGAVRDAASYLNVIVTLNGKSSSPKFNCTSCKQEANALTGLSMSVGSNPISYNTKTSVTVTASYTSGASKDVSADATYNDTSDPDIVEFNETETLS